MNSEREYRAGLMKKYYSWNQGSRKAKPWAILLFVSLCILVVLSSLYLVAHYVLQKELHQSALNVAMAAAAGVDADDVKSLGIQEDIEGETFQRIQAFLARLSYANPDTRYVALIRRIASADEMGIRYEILADNRIQDLNQDNRYDIHEVRNPPGTPFESKLYAHLSKAWHHPATSLGFSLQPIRTKVISGFAPVKDSFGQTVAVVVVTLSSASLERKSMFLQSAIVGVWLLLTVAAFCFWGLSEKRWMGCFLGSLMILVLFGSLYWIARRVVINEIRGQAMGVAIATAAGILPDDVAAIQSPVDMNGEPFRRIQGFLERIQDTNLDVRYIYIMRRSQREGARSSDYEYVVDEFTMDRDGNGAIDPSEVGNPPGTPYNAAPFPELVKAWFQPSADYEVSPDPPYPDLMSGYAPIKDSSGKTVGIVGVDIVASVVRQKLFAIRTVIFIVWVSLTLMIIGIMQFYFQKRELLREREKLLEQLRRNEMLYKELSITDDLTKLYNARYLHHQLKLETARSTRYESRLSIIFIDIDDFKSYNDANGHTEGDRVLRELGDIIQTSIRGSDSAFRYGGEEFIILLPETPCDAAVHIAHRIRTEFEDKYHYDKDSNRLYITVSIGIAEYIPSEDPTEFVKRADKSMYSAKRAGKNRVHLSEAEKTCS